MCLRREVAPGAWQLQICKAPKHVFEPRQCAGCLDAANCLVFVCVWVSWEWIVSFFCLQVLGNPGNLWLWESSSLNFWWGHWSLSVASGEGLQVFNSEPVHTQCLGGSDSHLPSTHPSLCKDTSCWKQRSSCCVFEWTGDKGFPQRSQVNLK